jgi:hypothetical protein
VHADRVGDLGDARLGALGEQVEDRDGAVD